MATMMVPVEAEKYASLGREETPRLTLREYVPAATPSARRCRRGRPQNFWENFLFAAALAAVLIFCFVGATRSFFSSAAISDRLPFVSTAVLPVTVHTGDTLWTYAQKYGASDTYILDRVETIARTNHLSSDTSLVAGQRLLIPVTNPLILARIESRQHLARQ